MIHYTEDSVPTRLSIAHLIFLLNQHKDRLLEKYLKPFNITGAQFRVMRLILVEQVDTPSELTRLLSIDSGAMTRMLDRLEQRNLLVRERCPNDRRQVRLKPTQEGIELSQEVHGLAADLLNELTGELSSDELSELYRIIRKILAPTGLMDEWNKQVEPE
ncbi:MarR family transcriptional regulator [Amphritea pacifica]|uniref:MarR family transcriptional regulator n=1 Tax=Amphritea pacifica TaxID=2811233 RepID=A0ABS2WBI5_9GAMM|nr:MarR family transcriptional regulator [Amphritea pacifica]MBN0989088.1 MarR family transcriptional regulator [Amphritea pacifica]MBN1007994.1 MarR family transcriptional regulator [Amphritea pacifica]